MHAEITEYVWTRFKQPDFMWQVTSASNTISIKQLIKHGIGSKNSQGKTQFSQYRQFLKIGMRTTNFKYQDK